MGKNSKDKRDIYYRLAKERGYRARSAFKLLHLHTRFSLLTSPTHIVDLCAAPGSWSQVAATHLRTHHPGIPTALVAVDLQDIAPIPGATILKGDITTEGCVREIVAALGEGGSAGLVMSDGAPDVTGVREVDAKAQGELVKAAVGVARSVLETGGSFVAKVFLEEDFDFLYNRLKIFFDVVHVVKPRSSRRASAEAFVVCLGFAEPAGLPEGVPPDAGVKALEGVESYGFTRSQVKVTNVVGPFFECGDLSAFD